ncbi:hypothetical protein M9M90_15810 [Phenylobacterium sp. LH3H17]|uniref:CC_3452 family protein n=1 Tax=Phenylobacterium sp. LH3H17 TaxID=2903901 RepID=UPI0020C9DBC7|nr:hypothetical protein [Phenylobacterium sp. LH3H17]UTP38677.1 hypothetical protein M9M90_15810 [Phenylobacterium sp. LH3H17]
MQLKLFSAGLLSCAVLAASPAFAAGFRAEARLVSPVSSAATTVVEGVEWTCAGDACVGVADKRVGLDSLMKECRKVAAAVGPLASYTSRGRILSAGNISVCNRLAAQSKSDSTLAAR